MDLVRAKRRLVEKCRIITAGVSDRRVERVAVVVVVDRQIRVNHRRERKRNKRKTATTRVIRE